MDIKIFLTHLQSLTQKDWQKLFDLLPELEGSKSFGKVVASTESEPGIFTFPYWSHAPIVTRFLQVVDDLKLIPVFDWTEWEQGHTILRENPQEFSNLDLLSLCKLFTVIVRRDRFSDGYLVSCFADGTIPIIIKEIQKQTPNKDDNKRIKIMMGDITSLKVDAIVNAANASLMGGGGVDGAIHRVGGSAIIEECKKIIEKQGECKTGEAVITSGGNLPAKYIIHTVGPIWNNDKRVSEQKLRNCYINSMALAEKYDLSTIAFPNISTGVYGYPKQEAADIAIHAIKDYACKSISEITFVCFDLENYEIYKSMLK